MRRLTRHSRKLEFQRSLWKQTGVSFPFFSFSPATLRSNGEASAKPSVCAYLVRMLRASSGQIGGQRTWSASRVNPACRAERWWACHLVLAVNTACLLKPH
jgi:hypothetical protein